MRDLEQSSDILMQADRKFYGTPSLAIEILSALFFLACLAVNGIKGKENGVISAKYFLRVTPPNYFFVIWAVIYLSTTISLVWALISHCWTLQTHLFFWLYCILNSLWIFTFTQGTLKCVCLSSIVLFLLAMSQYFIWATAVISESQLDQFSINKSWYYFMIQTQAFQLGWMVAASLLNFNIVLVYKVLITQEQSVFIFWSLAIVLEFFISFLALQQSQYIYKNFFQNFSAYYFSAGWALIGVFISSTRPDKEQLI